VRERRHEKVQISISCLGAERGARDPAGGLERCGPAIALLAIPLKMGVRCLISTNSEGWIPARAGMTRGDAFTAMADKSSPGCFAAMHCRCAAQARHLPV